MPKFFLIFTLYFLLPLSLVSQNKNFPAENYKKKIYFIEMRDGIKLYTTVYTPKAKGKYPILLKRTCYGVGAYGKDEFPEQLGPSKTLMQDGYIFVYQDVRGRYMSEGSFDNMRPILSDSLSEAVDESTDTYDTIEFLTRKLRRSNKRVGIWGISYPGHYAAVSCVGAHPALKAVSPQAPISDFYFDDFHHRGAYSLSYLLTNPVFGVQKTKNETEDWFKLFWPKETDGYKFYLDLGPIKNADKYYPDNFFWKQLKEHPNYDDFWQKRNILPHLNKVTPAVMVVGGWLDAEDLYGPLNIYKTIERNNPDIYNTIVMGPWSHGDWSRSNEYQIIGDINFGKGISEFYQNEIEARFFDHFLKQKNKKNPALPEAYCFDTGTQKWEKFDSWPPSNTIQQPFYLGADGALTKQPSEEAESNTSFFSNPGDPVPHSEEFKVAFTPRKYMTADQRFASKRKDVLTFETSVLSKDITLSGEIMAKLFVTTTGTDADWIVKLIDVYPDDYPKDTVSNVNLAGYQQLIRSEIMRGRFRNSFEKPAPFKPGKVTEVSFPLQDVLHTFKAGHRIMIQIQSTWFPLFDRNPQVYVDNIFEADENDFKLAIHQVFHSPEYPSQVIVNIKQ